MACIPVAVAQHAFEARACRFELLDEFPVESLHGDTVGRGVEHHPLVGAGERGKHDVLGGGVHGQDLIERLIFRPALHRPNRAAD
jgi:hypothetical protein